MHERDLTTEVKHGCFVEEPVSRLAERDMVAKLHGSLGWIGDPRLRSDSFA
jgi:hypothetical protein